MAVSPRKLAVPAAVAALVTGMTAAAPSASAGIRIALPAVCTSTAGDSVGTQNPDNPDAVDFSGTGTIDCLLGTNLVSHGVSVFSGTIPKGGCTGIEAGLVYRAVVTWDDGTHTSGTYTTFEETTLNGTAAVLIAGTTDASSTKFAGYRNTLISTSLGGCGTPADEADKTQVGTVLYLP